ncbi:MAG: aminotransferase class IV [Tatlockia sp.]|nr:aminotransferase class IV [Tatlockia sp.]
MFTKIVFQDEFNLPFTPDERVFLGEGLFETLLVINNKPCYSKEHWQRLTRASSSLAIPFTLSLDFWNEKLNEFIRYKNLNQGGIKVLLASGKALRGLNEKSKDSSLIFSALSFTKNAKPLKLISAAWQRDSKNLLYQVKSINYLEAIMARRIAAEAGADDVLFFNFQNQVTDTTIANFFIIKNECLFTPPLSSGPLPGIIRQRVLILCKNQNIECNEIELDKASLIKAEAAFTTNALQGIKPVHSWDNHIFNSKHPLIDVLQKLLVSDQSGSC